jgi:hypothetical protein
MRSYLQNDGVDARGTTRAAGFDRMRRRFQRHWGHTCSCTCHSSDAPVQENRMPHDPEQRPCHPRFPINTARQQAFSCEIPWSFPGSLKTSSTVRLRAILCGLVPVPQKHDLRRSPILAVLLRFFGRRKMPSSSIRGSSWIPIFVEPRSRRPGSCPAYQRNLGQRCGRR